MCWGHQVAKDGLVVSVVLDIEREVSEIRKLKVERLPITADRNTEATGRAGRHAARRGGCAKEDLAGRPRLQIAVPNVGKTMCRPICWLHAAVEPTVIPAGGRDYEYDGRAGFCTAGVMLDGGLQVIAIGDTCSGEGA